MVQTAVLAFVALVLGLFVIRPILISSAAQRALPAPDGPLALPPAISFASLAPAPGGRIANGSSGTSGMVLDGEVEGDFDMTGYPNYPRSAEPEGENDPATRLRRLIEKRQTESIEILRGWMEHEEERA